MQVELKSAVDQLSSRISLESVCCEAIMNGFHAGANLVELDFYEEDSGGLELNDENQEKLSKLIVRDNGEGFTKKNIESFLKLYSTHKEEIGCKGIGRLTYLKVFDSVIIESKSSEGNILCDFDYLVSEKSFENKSKPSLGEDGTEITYLRPKLKKGQAGIPLNFQKLTDRVKKEIMPHLYLSKKSLRVVFRQFKGSLRKKEIELSSESLPDLTSQKFTVQEHVSTSKQEYDFILSYVISRNANAQDKSSMDGYYCANKRSVYSFSDNRIGDSKINLKAIKGFKILFLVESKYLNNPQIIDAARQQFEVDATYNEIDSPISWQMINQQLLPLVEEILLKEFPDLEEKAEKLIEEVKDKYLHLVSYVELPNKIGGIYPEKYYVEKAEAKYKKDKEDFSKNKDSWRPEKVMRKASELAGRELIEYIQMRDHVITQLEKLKDKEALEDKVHGLIVDMKKIANEDELFTLENNNLWLIDDKFMGFSQVASDVEINKILGEVMNVEPGSSARRPDIAAFYRDKEKTKLVLFELKKMNAGTFDASKGIDQLGLYADLFRESGVKEIYLYLISDVDEDGLRVLKNRNFRPVFTREGQYILGVIGDIPCQVVVLNSEAVISDARARNQTFINLVKK